MSGRICPEEFIRRNLSGRICPEEFVRKNLSGRIYEGFIRKKSFGRIYLKELSKMFSGQRRRIKKEAYALLQNTTNRPSTSALSAASSQIFPLYRTSYSRTGDYVRPCGIPFFRRFYNRKQGIPDQYFRTAFNPGRSLRSVETRILSARGRGFPGTLTPDYRDRNHSAFRTGGGLLCRSV